MSQTLLQPGLVALGFACGGYITSASGVSDVASLIAENFESFTKHQESSESLFGVKARLISELNELATECSDEGWDGYGADPVNEAVVLQAKAFIRALPDHIPVPELSAEPDGEISFDWLPSRTKTFTLSVNAGNRVAYAWIDGANRGHAAELFEGNTLPARIVEELKRIVGNGVTLRTA